CFMGIICRCIEVRFGDYLINAFNNFTTYFREYFKNRVNMYENEKKHTAIVYRLVDENLTTFVKNIDVFAKAAAAIPELASEIERTLGIKIDNLFSSPEQFADCLTQREIERYNLAISGRSEEGNKKIKGLNEYINLYNQKNKGSKLPKLKELYKQILSDKATVSFVVDAIADDCETIDAVNAIYEQYRHLIDKGELKNALCSISDFDLNKIYVNTGTDLTSFSKSVYGNWSFISELRERAYDANYSGKKKKGTEKYTEERDTYFKKQKVISLGFIEECVKNYDENADEHTGSVTKYFADSYNACTNEISQAYKECESILSGEYKENGKGLLKDADAISKIKSLLDAMKSLQALVKTVMPKDGTCDTDQRFYNSLNYEELDAVIPVYNKVRNYMTQKPYSTEKFKLNFECPNFLAGWDKNKEQDNLGVLLKKGGNYYLVVMNTENKKDFNYIPECPKDYSGEKYTKVEYKLLSNPGRDLPHVFFADKNKTIYNPPKELHDKYKNGCHNKGKTFDLHFLRELIDYFKASIAKNHDWDIFGFNFSDTESYSDMNGFCKEVADQGYRITFKEIAAEHINELVKRGSIYLFQIYSKDFSPYSKGTPNLHTIYWKALFDADNLADVVYKLNGEAEVFYRKKSIEPKPTHPRCEPVENKNEETIKRKGKSVFDYDLIKDRRYCFDKFFFHVSLKMNFKSNNISTINDRINTAIREAKDFHLIGIDRGERNLIYISVINSNGEIVEQVSLNEIINEHNGVKYTANYHTILAKREEERDKARKSWSTIMNIKELKEGYMSQVVNKLVTLMLKYNAVIVLEDLNSGFKNSRKKVEKSVYDKFETMLVNKLAYLVRKEITDKRTEGGLLNAYQLALPGLKNTLQNGAIFYIPAWNTSKIDPTTGFVNLFNLTEIKTKEAAKGFIAKFGDIRYNEKEGYFEFDADYTDFTDRAADTRTKWTICTYGERIRAFRNPEKNNKWDGEPIDLTAEYKKLFDRYGIDLSSIQSEIEVKENLDADFFFADGKDGFLGFMRLFRLTVQLRNSASNSDVDYILSPVKNANGKFFDSRKAAEQTPPLPCDADANGAYNIARKGLMILNRIREAKEQGSKIGYAIKHSEWLKYVQQQDK
ncbi:MAG: type V CRISPR-associated protein Cas12a/Cpf1, partial [Synergistes sp.]|nr:type V CRISPR-associated protein Cas12a/Cpf1 [Synergistes sp.]